MRCTTQKKENFFFEDQRDIELYSKKSCTFPVEIMEEDKQILVEKKENYLWKHKLDQVDKIVSIGHRDQCSTPNQKIKTTKSQSNNFLQKVRVSFNQMEERKLKKISISNIFKITIDVGVKPKWTDKQNLWRKRGYRLRRLFSRNLKTISRIDDFRRKYLMSYWRRKCSKTPVCELCGHDWDREHIFYKCKVVKNWENKVYGVEGKNGRYTNTKRRIRKYAMMDNSSENHTYSWVYNWCIWKTYWEIVFQKFEKCKDEDKQAQVFTKHLKFFEHLHLMYSIYCQSKNHTLDTVIFIPSKTTKTTKLEK